MRVTTLREKSSLAEIADRLFAKLTPETTKLAEAALLKANPELAEPEALRPGAIIRVPEVPTVKLKSARAEDDPVGQTREMLKTALKSYQELLAQRFKSEKEDLTEQSRIVTELRQTHQDSPEISATSEKLLRTLQKRVWNNETWDPNLQTALQRALKELAE